MQKANAQYKVIFLDWDGTLSVSRFWGHWQQEQPEFFARLQREVFGQPGVVQPWLLGELSTEQCLQLVASRIGASEGELLQNLQQSARAMQFVSPQVPAYIRRLRASGMHVVIATDNMDVFSRWTVQAMGLANLCDGVLNSADLGALKKQKRADGQSAFFGDYLVQYNLQPAQCILIDDSRHNQVVEEFGLHYSYVERGQGLLAALDELLPTSDSPAGHK